MKSNRVNVGLFVKMEVFDHENKKTSYRVVVEGNPKLNFKDLGDIYNERNEKVGNIYLKDRNTPFLAINTAYVWLIHSDDNGKTWSNPIDLSAQVKKDWMKFLVQVLVLESKQRMEVYFSYLLH